MNTVRVPAERPASTSRQRSPTVTLRDRSTSQRRAESRIIPGFGLRHAQPSASSCGQTTTSSRPSSSLQPRVDGVATSSGSLRAAGDVRLVGDADQPEPGRGQLAHAAAHAGQQLDLVGRSRAGAGGRRRRRRALRTPSRSRNTAGTLMRAAQPRPEVLEHRLHRRAQRLARAGARRPARAPGSASVSRRTTGTSPFQPRSADRRTRCPRRRGRGRATSSASVGDLAHGDVVAGGDVEGAERLRGPRSHAPSTAATTSRDVDVGLALRAVAHDRRGASGRRSSRRTKSKPTPWVWRRPTTLPKRKAKPLQVEHVRVGARSAPRRRACWRRRSRPARAGRGPRRPRCSPRSP